MAPTTLSIDELEKSRTRSSTQKSTDGAKRNRDDSESRSSSEPKAKVSKKNPPKTAEERSVPKAGSLSPELISALEHMSNGFLLKSDAKVIRDFFHYHRYSHLVEVALP